MSKEQSEVMTVKVSVPMSSEMKKTIERMAHSGYITVAELIRRMIKEKMKK